MMTEPSLFSPIHGGGWRASEAALPSNRTPTSKAAAQRKQASGTTDSDRTKIILHLLKHPEGRTREELGNELGIRPDSVRPRVYELLGEDQRFLDRGGVACLYVSGEKRPTTTGSAASVLKHTRFRSNNQEMK